MEYRAFEQILSNLHRVPPTEAKAFRSRLRILRDVGVPAVIRSGKGSRVDYRLDDVFLGHLGLLLDDAGFPPLVLKDVAETFKAERIYTRFLSGRVGCPAALWLRVNVLRHTFGGEQRMVTVELAALSNHLQFLEELKSFTHLDLHRHPATFQGLINLEHVYADCLREVANKGA